ncbi:phosphoribosylaminoimidazolesuccinocarboxamide synthase, partial [Rhizobium leguminosarum]|uniref:phosphoribosylaminoimidazolesuccinocarboxamide synthase n=1 Tax=Rhizobium leguminosarum TaxID=384 RepID=UPI003F963E56
KRRLAAIILDKALAGDRLLGFDVDDRGLLDTKYEFGTEGDGNIILADEIHTQDSSRYWLAASYPASFAEGKRPESFDKDFV